MSAGSRHPIQDEFGRAASAFARRTEGRFDHLGVVEFARVRGHHSVLEVGVGTGNFLKLFADSAGTLVGVDVTEQMLIEARRDTQLQLVRGDAFRLPFQSRSLDLVASAQMLHHIQEPLDVLKEMRRVSKRDGRVLVVDQVATESYEEMSFMNELETLRDPTHAASRPPSALRMLVAAAGMTIEDERVVEDRSRFSKWMWPDEFPSERIEAVRSFIERFGHETGMEFEREGDDWGFTRRRIMLLARR